MVYITFPTNLTEEEQMLQAKYQKLKKKVRTSKTNAWMTYFEICFRLS